HEAGPNTGAGGATGKGSGGMAGRSGAGTNGGAGGSAVKPDAALNTDSGATTTPDASSDAGLQPTRSQCAVAKNGPTKHPAKTLTADETWSADDSPHIVDTWFIVRAHLTIEPCAVIQLAADAYIQIDTPGVLDARGSERKAVSI